MMIARWIPMTVVAAVLTLPSIAGAQIYKFARPDGTIVYTDSLAELPQERRIFYNKRAEEQEAARREMERTVGKENLERQEAEAERARLASEAADRAEQSKRLAELDARIRLFRDRADQREAAKKVWQTRWKTANEKLAALLAEFEATQEKYGNIASRADFTLLPGQAKERDHLEKRLKVLEGQIDAMIVEIEETIPNEARKAGVPPGWIRG